MPRLIHATPKYRHHRVSGQAVVLIQGKYHYLGPFGSERSKAAYDRLIAEWLVKGRAPRSQPKQSELTIKELIVAFWRFVVTHYVKNGEPTAEQDCIKAAIRPLRRLYGNIPAVNFGPVSLKTVRQIMVDSGLARSTINGHVGRIRRIFRWATAEELLPASVYQALAALPGLQRGRTTAREPEPILPVADEVIDATLPHLPSVVADMVRFQRLTGCRPSEVCMIRPGDVDTGKKVWQYLPLEHKSEHHGKQRIVFIGPKAQNILRPYLLRPADSFCFSPADSERKRLAALHEARSTPLHYGNRPGTNRIRRKHKVAPGNCYDGASFRRAIERACDRAFPAGKDLPPEKLKEWQRQHRWAPNRLRHTTATELRKRFGLEAAQVILGHSYADVTQIYAERDLVKASEVISEVG
jgi:integrase